VERLQEQESLDRDRLTTVARSLELARNEFDRIRTLFETDEVGTRSGVEQAEVRLNQSQDAHDQLRQMVELYGPRIAEAQSALAAAVAQEELAQANLSRTEVRAPFAARIKMANVEAGQYVAPGTPVLHLADDSVLEVSVPLDSIDARRWLRFTETPTAESGAWFNHLEPVTCKIFWTEEPGAHTWYGNLDRVESFDPASRTLTVAVRIAGTDASAPEGESLPLVEGMYCQVAIPGKTMEDVFRIPRWAVSFDGKAYVTENERLQIREVDVVRTQDEETFVSAGLAPGDTVIVTRLVNPLPNSLLDVQLFEATEDAP
jgi:RND family efflux transporter MFP subunit